MRKFALLSLVLFLFVLMLVSCKNGKTPPPAEDLAHIHTEVIDPEVAPVCGQDGLTQGIHCSECGEVLVRQNPIPAPAKECYVVWRIVEPATKTKDGWKVYECLPCGKEYGTAMIYAGSQNLKYEENPDGTYYVSSVSYGDDMDIVIPEKYNDQPITGIGDRAISNGVYSLTLNSYITDIDENAFGECGTLTCISVSPDNPSFCSVDGNLYSKDGRTLIKYAPANPATTFTVPDGVTAVRREAFRQAVALESVVFPEGVVSVGQGAFYDCWALRSVVFPDSVTELGKFLFEYCRALESVTLPAGLKEIPDGMFFGCGPLRSVNIPAGVTRIGKKSFSGCYSLQEIILPDGVSEIGDAAFESCEGLRYIYIPASLTKIGNWVFQECEGMQSFDVAADNAAFESIDGSLYDKKSKVLLWYASGKQDEVFVLPDGVTGIGEQAFLYSPYIKRVEIPDSVTWIGQSAFGYCGALQSVVIGKGITTLAPGLFFHCYALESVTFSENVTLIDEYAFACCGKLTEFHFGGTMERWASIEKKSHWAAGIRHYTVYCADGTLAEKG